jgi:beta-carotene 3-hydroxylase
MQRGSLAAIVATMSVWMGLLLAFGVVIAMEGVAYAGHRWVMHGPMWWLHKSHHEPREGLFERNDWFAVMGAIPSIFLIFAGTQLGWGEWLAWVGLGISIYGLIYFGFHDIIVHRRLETGYVPRWSYMKRIVQAHRLHHVVESREGTVSFGFLYAPPVEKLKAAIKANEKARMRRNLNQVAEAD